MTLTIRKLVVLGSIGTIFLLGNVMLAAFWLQEMGLIDWANYVRKEFLTGTAITVILALLVLLVRPGRDSGNSSAWVSRCSVCDRRLIGRVNYCSDCGSKV